MTLSAYDVPPELLDKIFRIATDVPDPLVCFAQDYHGSRSDSSGESYRRYKESLTTKLALCEVSRCWNAVATPLIYERVIISYSLFFAEHKDKCRQLDALLRTVRRNASESPRDTTMCGRLGGTSLGGLVRRLDLAVPDNHGGIADDAELSRISRILVDLVENLPYLEVFGVRTSESLSPLDTLKSLSPRLKHLHWRTDSFGPGFAIPTTRFLAFLEHHPNLETVHVRFNFDDTAPAPASALPQWSRRALQSVKHWVLWQNQVDILSGLPSNIFPNLKGVTFPYSPDYGGNLSRLREFLTVHGRNLTVICVKPQWQLKDMLQAVDPLCPQLREIHLVFTYRSVRSSTISETSMAIRMPRVVTLGLSLYYHSDNRHEEKWQKVIKLPWKEIFPSLQRIRLVEEIDVNALDGIPEEFAKIVNRSQSYGVDLEDNFGRPLATDALVGWI